MKILIVRHADPDYEHDSLTDKGRKEAEYLSGELSKIKAKAYYCSPLGRAQRTAEYTMKKVGREFIVLPWLREFDAPIIKPNRPEKKTIVWDWLPADWMSDERYFHKDEWYTTKVMEEGEVEKQYHWVCSGLDRLLEEHGYRRKGLYYQAEDANKDTLVFFCHFGVECVILSHLLNISPMILWHGFCAAPSSVTTVVTEERREGIASMRMLRFGETTHLYINYEEPAFAARFRECYTNSDERID